MRRELTLLLTVALTVLAVLVTGCGTGKRSNMERLLAEADSINRNYIPFTTDSVMLDVVDYYDRHGTPNERMRAHYLLGCVYRDLGEAPHAIDCYNDAIAKADTTSADCDYHTLGCICSQMGDVFHRQLLLTEEITARKQSQHYAEIAGETLNAISSLKLSAGAYILLNKRDTAEAILNDVVHLYMNNGYEQEAIQTSLMLMHLYVGQSNRLAELKRLVNQYDTKSNMFDMQHKLQQNASRQFYYYKGKYYEVINQLDSAEHYYRRIAYPNMPFTAKDFMFSGLLSVFKKKKTADSIAKYSQLYCAVNDSSIILRDQQLTAQMTASYKYNSIQKEAKENAEKSYIANIRSICLLVALLVTVALIAVILRKNRNKRKCMETLYNKAIVERAKLREELNSLKVKNYDVVISQKEEEIERLNQTISKYEDTRLQTTAKNNMAQFEQSDIVRLFSEKRQFKKGEEPLTGSDWKQLISEFSLDMPSAYAVMTSSRLSPLQLQVCILLLLDYEESIIAALRETKPQTINNAKIRANRKIFMADNSITLKSNLIRLIAT